jgi:hypothetical protein
MIYHKNEPRLIGGVAKITERLAFLPDADHFTVTVLFRPFCPEVTSLGNLMLSTPSS